jgi:phosphoribosylamine--glycine ligase/phosphoribosylglycinamide formyltransferase/phosphoribosylformylglycinamidine cyclo-ligase/phosphoribosylamine--glycine ligase/phosphoribosylformylglycinamidine cyclo-ligase
MFASRRVTGQSSFSRLFILQAFTKDFLQEHGIPTAKYRTFTYPEQAFAYVESLEEGDRQVVKASGLAAGKGVLLPTTKEETVAAVKEIMSDRAFGAAGDTCVIESFMTGPEASCLAFCDGKTAVLMPAAQDHKRALDNDMGLNTGGMGAYAPAPCVTPELQKEIEAMCIKTVEKMAERGTPYVGVLYAGMM